MIRTVHLGLRASESRICKHSLFWKLLKLLTRLQIPDSALLRKGSWMQFFHTGALSVFEVAPCNKSSLDAYYATLPQLF